MKYQCNSCGKVHDYRSDAVNCHPDINEIPDEQLESRLAAQQNAHLTGGGLCAECGSPSWAHGAIGHAFIAPHPQVA